MRIYLAGPDVFAPNAAAHGSELKALCAAAGAIGVFPLDGDGAASADQPAAIRRHCLGAIRSCNVIVANMTPFRGPSLDPGTAYEMGFAAALGKPVVGYTLDARSYTDRVAATMKCHQDADGVLRDEAGMAVEKFAAPLTDNLMVACGMVALFSGAAEAIAFAVGGMQ